MAKDPSEKIKDQIRKAGLPTDGEMHFHPELDENKKGEPIKMATSKESKTRLRARKGCTGLLAIGSSGPWEVAIDQTTSGSERWFAQVEGPLIYLCFEVPSSMDVVDDAIRMLASSQGEAERNATTVHPRGFVLGTSKSVQVNLVRDDEFSDRYFLIIEGKKGVVVRFTLSAQDRVHLLDALSQVREDLE